MTLVDFVVQNFLYINVHVFFAEHVHSSHLAGVLGFPYLARFAL